MKTSTKLEVKSQRPKRYIRSDAGRMSANSSWRTVLKGGAEMRGIRTDAECEEEKQRDGM